MTGMIEILDDSASDYTPPRTARVEPEPDVIVLDDYSMVVFYPHTEAGEFWLDENLPDDCPMIGSGCAVECKYAGPIVEGMIAAGLNLKLGAHR